MEVPLSFPWRQRSGDVLPCGGWSLRRGAGAGGLPGRPRGGCAARGRPRSPLGRLGLAGSRVRRGEAGSAQQESERLLSSSAQLAAETRGLRPDRTRLHVCLSFGQVWGKQYQQALSLKMQREALCSLKGLARGASRGRRCPECPVWDQHTRGLCRLGASQGNACSGSDLLAGPWEEADGREEPLSARGRRVGKVTGKRVREGGCVLLASWGPCFRRLLPPFSVF